MHATTDVASRPRGRARGVSLPDDVANNVVDEHLRASELEHPKLCFRAGTTKSWSTSDWPAAARYGGL